MTGTYRPLVRASSLLYPYWLTSFGYMASVILRDEHRAESLAVDSGAFTAWNSGSEIDLGEYAAYCQKLLDQRVSDELIFFNLDVIPGLPRVGATRREARAAAKRSRANAEQLRAAGIPVIEVFHLYDPPDVGADLIERYEPGQLLALGGLVGARPDARRAFCDGFFHQLRERFGWDALPAVHGLGVASPELIRRYPWWSCDASSWYSPDRHGTRVNGVGFQKPRGEQRKVRAFAYLECERWLANWRRMAEEMTRAWATRGVNIIEPGGALVCP